MPFIEQRKKALNWMGCCGTNAKLVKWKTFFSVERDWNVYSVWCDCPQSWKFQRLFNLVLVLRIPVKDAD